MGTLKKPGIGPRNERGELLHELKRFKDDVRRSIPPAALEAVQQPAIG